MKIRHLASLKRSAYFRTCGLPCVIRIMRAAPSNVFVAMHDHEFTEIVFVAVGRLKHLHEHGTQDLSAGDFFVIHPGMRHGYAELSDDTVVYNVLVDPQDAFVLTRLTETPFAAGRAGAPHTPSPGVLGHIAPRHPARDTILTLLDFIRTEEHAADPLARFAVESALGTVCAIFSRHIHPKRRDARDDTPSPVAAVIAHMTDRLDEKLSVADLAEMAEMPPRTFCRLFRHVTGKSPVDYLIGLRLQESARRLAATTETVEQIAARCGFSSATHLAHTLRSHLNLTASDIRMQAHRAD